MSRQVILKTKMHLFGTLVGEEVPSSDHSKTTPQTPLPTSQTYNLYF